MNNDTDSDTDEVATQVARFNEGMKQASELLFGTAADHITQEQRDALRVVFEGGAVFGQALSTFATTSEDPMSDPKLQVMFQLIGVTVIESCVKLLPPPNFGGSGTGRIQGKATIIAVQE